MIIYIPYKGEHIKIARIVLCQCARLQAKRFSIQSADVIRAEILSVDAMFCLVIMPCHVQILKTILLMYVILLHIFWHVPLLKSDLAISHVNLTTRNIMNLYDIYKRKAVYMRQDALMVK